MPRSQCDALTAALPSSDWQLPTVSIETAEASKPEDTANIRRAVLQAASGDEDDAKDESSKLKRFNDRVSVKVRFMWSFRIGNRLNNNNSNIKNNNLNKNNNFHFNNCHL